MKRKLLIAYGNPDRQDDGAGWYVLGRVAEHFGIHFTDYNEDFYSLLGNDVDFFFSLQLLPEMAEIISGYDCVAFMDASVPGINDQLNITKINPIYITSPLSHHMAPQTLLDLLVQLQIHVPEAWLLTIPGSKFGFVSGLSDEARAQAERAVEWLVDWMSA